MRNGNLARSRWLALAGAALAIGACNRDPAPSAPAEPAPSAAERTSLEGDDLSRLDELAAVGYVDAAPAPAGAAASGVELLAPELASPGYDLVTDLTGARAWLLDRRGNELARWSDPRGAAARWSRAILLHDGDVLALSTRDDVLLRYRFDGSLRWSVPLEVHHDAMELANGELLVLTRHFRTMPELDPVHRSVDNVLTRVSADGKVLEEVSLFDAIQASPDVLAITAPPGAERLPPDATIDPIHANAAKWMENAELAAADPLYGPDHVLVTLRYPDTIAVLDWKTRRIVWAWGAGELEGPHEATLVENGHFLVFDNGNGYEERGFSRVLEIDPLARAIVWEYRAPVESELYSEGRGTAQGLPNGDVLVTSSNQGQAFEVTRDGQRVWSYASPLDEKGARAVVRVRRYPPEAVEPFLPAARKE